MVYSLNVKKLLLLYKKFFLIRNLELQISKKYAEGKMRCPTHLSVGQELVPSILSLLWKKNDYVISTHRGHAHFLAKGGSLKKMIAEIYGKKTGTSKGKGGSMHLIDLNVNFMGTSAIVGNSIPIGVGLGLASKIKKEKNISYIFFGDGAVEEGVFYESLNFAAVRNLPVIFICENNLYSVYSALKVRQPRNRKIYELANSIGVRSVRCDGNNYKELYKKFSIAIEFVKKYKKPFFIEVMCYRWLEHCGPGYDNDIGYRTYKEFQKYKSKDCFKDLNTKLINIYGEKKIKKIDNEILNQIKNAFIFAQKSPFPKEKEKFEDVYAK